MEVSMEVGVGIRLRLFYEEKDIWWRLRIFQDTERTRRLFKK
jgi:hypothetical protein